MESRICTKCGKEKEISEFSKKYKTKKGEQKYQTKCKECVNEDMISYRENHVQDRVEYDKKYYDKNKNKILNYKKKYHIENKDVILIKKKKYRDKPESKLIQKEYRLNNKEYLSYLQKDYRLNNREYLNELQSKYRKENPHVIAWRSILHRVIKQFNTIKEGHTIDILGYSANDLKTHIESLFKEGMTWENHGEWEIDHISPVSLYSSDTPINIVNALTNLQPLWKDENREKFNKIF
jgi:hypothetical protein